MTTLAWWLPSGQYNLLRFLQPKYLSIRWKKFIFQISSEPQRAMATENGTLILESHNYPVSPHSEISASKDGTIFFIFTFLDLLLSPLFWELFLLATTLNAHIWPGTGLLGNSHFKVLRKNIWLITLNKVSIFWTKNHYLETTGSCSMYLIASLADFMGTWTMRAQP